MSTAGIDNFLGVAANTRTKLKGVNMIVVILAIVLSIMVIHTRNLCIHERDLNKFESQTTFMNTTAIILLVMALMLFLYDMAIMFKFI
jgi:uncharacterized membrane protein YidH (DUF202 family)